MSESNTNRDNTIDILRGFAVAVMAGVHTSNYLWYAPHYTWWFPFYYSMTAPLFIAITGMMVALSLFKKSYSFKHYLIRGFAVLIMAIFLDVAVYQIYPFVGFDVLYVIAFAIPLSYLFLKLNRITQLVLILFIFMITPILHGIFGYTNEVLLLSLEKDVYAFSNLFSILERMFVNGWFPIFPWLGFAFLGAWFGDLRWRCKAALCVHNTPLLYIGGALSICGTLLLYSGIDTPGIDIIFAPFSGYFGYIIIVTGLGLVFFSLIQRSTLTAFYYPFMLFGKMALFFYIVHLALLEYVSYFYYKEFTLQNTVIGYLILIGVMFILMYSITILKRSIDWQKQSWILHFLFGK
jgi:uncharacterized membrane protein